MASRLFPATENPERARLVWEVRGARHPVAGVRLEARVTRYLNSACVGMRRLLGTLQEQGAPVVHPLAKGEVSASARDVVVSARMTP